MDRITVRIRQRWPIYLWTCPRCVSVWAGGAVTAMFFVFPWGNWPLAIAWLYLVQFDDRSARRWRAPRVMAGGSDIVAASCAQTDVQTAINTAVDGDRVLVP